MKKLEKLFSEYSSRTDLLTASEDEQKIIEEKIWMNDEKMFTREWWKEKFKNAKSIGYGAKELRDEDKVWFAGPINYRWLGAVVEAVIEKFGDDAIGTIQEAIYNEGKRMGAFMVYYQMWPRIDLRPPTLVAGVRLLPLELFLKTFVI
jgi:hypothetical protein